MKFETEALVRAPVDDVWRWWTDYGRPGETLRVGHGIGPSERRILEAGPSRVVYEERIPLVLGQSVRVSRRVVDLYPDERRLEERGEGGVPFEETWRFEAADGGAATRVRRETRVPSKAADAARAVSEPVARALADRDLRHHVREFERERGTQAPPK